MHNNLYYPILWLLISALSIGLICVSRGIDFFRKQMVNDPKVCDQCGRQLRILGIVRQFLYGFMVFIVVSGFVVMYLDQKTNHAAMIAMRNQLWPIYEKQKVWIAPAQYLADTDRDPDLITYGRDLIVHTQDYFGTHGLVKAGAINGMNCQNCHLEAGTKPFGNNYFGVHSTYPQMRARSGALETIPKRINDCFQRSLHGEPLDTTSREMLAMLAYMRWLGTGVPKGEKPKGAGLVEVPFLDRAADPSKGQKIYTEKCASCHGINGQGLPMPNSARDYPPLWGELSYNEGAGLFRMSRFAGYVKANMPFGATYQNPQLSDAEAWDLAAFVNSNPRPKHPFLGSDWPKIEKKPFDHPFGPYKDTFPEIQHKYGPFGPIIENTKVK